MNNASVEALTYHGPGWKLEADGIEYVLWAPRRGHETGDDYLTPRDHWAAAWDNEAGDQGDFSQGSTLADVLSIFPAAVADKFKAVTQ